MIIEMATLSTLPTVLLNMIDEYVDSMIWSEGITAVGVQLVDGLEFLNIESLPQNDQSTTFCHLCNNAAAFIHGMCDYSEIKEDGTILVRTSCDPCFEAFILEQYNLTLTFIPYHPSLERELPVVCHCPDRNEAYIIRLDHWMDGSAFQYYCTGCHNGELDGTNINIESHTTASSYVDQNQLRFFDYIRNTPNRLFNHRQ